MNLRLAPLRSMACLVALAMGACCETARAGYESAPYQVIEADGAIEIREYPDLLLASTAAKFEARGNDGSFMRLFRYISGNNAQNQKIEMTTPVFMEADSPQSPGQMGFVLPQEIAKAGAPAPAATEVTLRTRAGGRFAVIRFSGVMDTKLAAAQEHKLREWLQKRDLQGEATSERAGYDPPFTPGLLRRNEVLIRLKSATEAKSTASEAMP